MYPFSYLRHLVKGSLHHRRGHTRRTLAGNLLFLELFWTVSPPSSFFFCLHLPPADWTMWASWIGMFFLLFYLPSSRVASVVLKAPVFAVALVLFLH